MRPVKQTPAHHTDKFAELVCSNSLRANSLTNAVGVLKEEMRVLDSAIIAAADECSVPAGGALAVDRHEFAANVTEKVKSCCNNSRSFRYFRDFFIEHSHIRMILYKKSRKYRKDRLLLQQDR